MICTYIDVIVRAIWSTTSLLMQEPEADFLTDILQAQFVQRMMDIVQVLGEQAVFTHYFDKLASIFTQALNLFCSCDFETFFYDQMASYDAFERVIPFLMDVLAHVILHFDDSQGPINLDWISESSPDFFAFSKTVDTIEVL